MPSDMETIEKVLQLEEPGRLSGLDQALAMPWLVQLEIKRWLTYPLMRLFFGLHGVAWGTRWRVLGKPMIQRYGRSRIELGDGLVLRSWAASNPLVPHHPVVLATRNESAIIKIGEDCGFTGTTIVAAERIEIGDRVQVGANCTIVDTDFHPLTPEGRQANMAAGRYRSVIIQDDVFIGMNSLILKGVVIGEGSVIGAGSVVARNVPPRTIVAGNPARIVREL